MTPESELQYANNPVVKGEQARAMFGQIFENLVLCEHTLLSVDYVPPRIYQAVRVRYRVKGFLPSEDVEVPGFVIFFVNEDAKGGLKAYRSESYVDAAQVFAQIAQRSTDSAKL